MKKMLGLLSILSKMTSKLMYQKKEQHYSCLLEHLGSYVLHNLAFLFPTQNHAFLFNTKARLISIAPSSLSPRKREGYESMKRRQQLNFIGRRQVESAKLMYTPHQQKAQGY